MPEEWAATGLWSNWVVQATWFSSRLSGQPNMEDRLKGFKDVLESRPNIHIVDVIDIKSDARAAFDKTQELWR